MGKRLVKLEQKYADQSMQFAALKEQYENTEKQYAALQEKCEGTEILSNRNFDSVNKIGKKQDDQINYWMRFLNVDENVQELSSDVLLDRIEDWVEDNRDKFDGIDDKFDSIDSWQRVKGDEIGRIFSEQGDLKAEVKCFELDPEILNFRARSSRAIN